MESNISVLYHLDRLGAAPNRSQNVGPPEASVFRS